MTALPCQCPGGPLGHGPCVQVVTQEDLLCDKCRFLDCPTMTRENYDQRWDAWFTTGWVAR